MHLREGSVDLTIEVPKYGDRLFEAVFNLGESQSRYVGMLPLAAWQSYCESDLLLAAVERTQEPSPDVNEQFKLLGYAAYRLPRNEVVLAHLVVDPAHRGKGVARALVDHLSAMNSDRAGIAARCRRDYPANRMWPSLGFIARGDRRGRSLEGHFLTDWWRDHGHPDLLTWGGPTADALPVVCDANIFIDLHSDGPDARKTKAIVNGILDGRIELLVTPELHNELDRQKDPERRHRFQALVSSYPEIRVSGEVLDATRMRISDGLSTAPKSQRDRSDLMHVAYTAAAGVPALVSRDNPALKRLSVAADAEGVQLVSPEDLVVLVDQLETTSLYNPAALLGTGYQLVEASVADLSDLESFFDTATGERKRNFELRLRELAVGRDAGAHRLIYRAPGGDPVALLGVRRSGPAVQEVTLGRMRQNALQATLAAQMGSQLRGLAHESGATVVRVSDPHLHPFIARALLADGFRQVSVGRFVGLTIPKLTTVANLKNDMAVAGDSLAADERAVLAAVLGSKRPEMLERQLRPLRILDAELDTWLVPIRPAFASQLFGYPEELFPRSDELGISIEHVYYRAGRSGETTPGRVLWYVSGSQFGQVIGCSDLIEVVDGAPRDLFRRFKRLGVYTRQQVIEAADARGTVRALRVVNTSMFPHPVGLKDYRLLADKNCHTAPLVSASKLPKGLFADLMRGGYGEE